MADEQSADGKKEEEPYTGSVVGFLEEASDDEAEEVVTKSAGPAKKRVKATFKVRVYAKKKGVDIDSVSGTGPDGRVTEEDVDKAS